MCKCDDLCIRFDTRGTQYIGIQLPKFTKASLLGALIAEEVSDRVPAGGHWDIARFSGNHARQRWRHFGAQRHFSLAAISKGVALFFNDFF